MAAGGEESHALDHKALVGWDRVDNLFSRGSCAVDIYDDLYRLFGRRRHCQRRVGDGNGNRSAGGVGGTRCKETDSPQQSKGAEAREQARGECNSHGLLSFMSKSGLSKLGLHIHEVAVDCEADVCVADGAFAVNGEIKRACVRRKRHGLGHTGETSAVVQQGGKRVVAEVTVDVSEDEGVEILPGGVPLVGAGGLNDQPLTGRDGDIFVAA